MNRIILVFPTEHVSDVISLVSQVEQSGSESHIANVILASSTAEEPVTHLVAAVEMDDAGLALAQPALPAMDWLATYAGGREDDVMRRHHLAPVVSYWREIILDVPEGTEFAQMPAAIRAAIGATGAQWTVSGQMPGTRAFNGREAVIAIQNVSMRMVEAMIAIMGVDWSVIACKSLKSLPTGNTLTETVTGPDGEQMTVERDETGPIVERPVPQWFVDYMADVPVVDADGIVTGMQRPAEIGALNRYGDADWVIEA